MSDDRLSVTRQELYELAWSKPMVELARDFGISDVALAKRCRNLRVPVPGRGYWARVEAGQTPRRTALPEHEPSWRDHHALTVEPPPKDVLDSLSNNDNAVAAIVAMRVKLEHLPVSSSQTLSEATAVVRRTALVHKHPARHELPFARGEKTGAILDLNVSAGALGRALLLADALLRTAESLGWRFVESTPKGSGPGASGKDLCSATCSSRVGQLLVDGERIAFRIEERMTEEPRALQPTERLQEPMTEAHRAARGSLQSTGALRLVRIDGDSCAGRRKSWYDRRGRQLETQLPEILRGFFELALEIRARRVDAERRRREREEEERQRRELEERREANGRLIRELEIQAGAWHRARFLRAYLRAARRAVPKGLTGEFLGRRIDFMQWAEAYINGLDPLQEQPRAEDTLPERYSWAGSSALKDELSRLLGHEWANSWKYGPRQDAQQIKDDSPE